ncbi:MAG: amidohydrolase/deacetylase family metallohydrolase [Chloroflexota bacterium]|nr:amidohydrolase/deacetylase family metallohydrolase [Chloroflexota bacterium]MDE2946725.1 amidohydrolase/deacetylase family metallohydrolase [Chloroflexota bacterium]
MTQYDFLLKGGRVIDPANGIDAPMDVAVATDKIAAVAPDIPAAQATQITDVAGLIVTPGLIDIHAHVYHTREPETLSVIADHHSFRAGVTTVVDTGTAGAKHFLHFKRTVIDRARTRIFAYINIVQSGMLGPFEQDVKEMDPALAASIALAYPDDCVGIKTAHYWVQRPFDQAHPPWAAVDRALEASAICGKPLMVDFWHREGRSYQDLLRKMQPGDIHTHVYAQQFPILNEANEPADFMFEARERGIIFDLGHGAGSFWFRQAIPALQGGFPPDSISTDLHIGNVNGVVHDMLNTMSKLLCMGMPLPEVIARSTAAPAHEIGHPELGTLSIGAEADIAVLRLERGQFGYVDCGYARMNGDRKLSCDMTIRAGEIVYDLNGRSTPAWEDAPPEYWQIRYPKDIV